jgi:hypothetical protein
MPACAAVVAAAGIAEPSTALDGADLAALVAVLQSSNTAHAWQDGCAIVRILGARAATAATAVARLFVRAAPNWHDDRDRRLAEAASQALRSIGPLSAEARAVLETLRGVPNLDTRLRYVLGE